MRFPWRHCDLVQSTGARAWPTCGTPCRVLSMVEGCTVIPVDRDHLRLAFNKLGVPDSSYSFSGPGQGECYVIEPDDDGWITYYSE